MPGAPDPRGAQADRFGAFRTGVEANALCSLSVMGGETDFMTRLPDTAIGRCA